MRDVRGEIARLRAEAQIAQMNTLYNQGELKSISDHITL